MKIMKLWILLSYACMALLVAPGYTESIYSDEVWDALNYRRKLDRGDWLPFKMAIPEHYVVLPATRDKDIGLDPGFFCGERSTIKDLWQQLEKEPAAELHPNSACFYVTWSWEVAQRGPDSFSVSDQELRSALEKKGASSIQICNLRWNEYPVKSIEIEFPPHTHTFTAWIGLNTGGEAIRVQYSCPENSSLFDEECAIWNHFLHKSTGLSREEYFNRVMSEIKPLGKEL